MSLASGTLLGPYEVLAPLGAGGMGEVYRARDTRLGRDVAVKVLLAGTANDPAAAARFDREARAIAAVSHPSICALYDVGHDAGRTYLVMELLEGETLQQRLARGPLDTSSLVDLSIALADGLEVAHARGLIHRDLKPANMFLTRHGQIKILDFGLAKAIDGTDSDDETRMGDNAITSPGSAVGTVAYMSPEQLRGEPVDARSDLFSFGVVLYEMATGRRAFQGNTTGAISAAILRDEPPAPHTICAELPAKFEEIILKAIEKDRDLRYQTAAELRTDLKRLKRGSASDAASVQVKLSGMSQTQTMAPTSDSRIAIGMVKRHRGKVAIVATALMAVLVAAAWWLTHDRHGEQKALAIDIQPLTVFGDACCAGTSPDGGFVAFVRNRNGASSVWVRQISGGSAVEIVPPTAKRDIRTVSVTPDGGFVDFTMRDAADADFDLWRVPFLGGQARPLVRNVWSGVGWSADGKRIAFIRRAVNAAESSVVVANADGTGERVVATRKNPADFVNVNFRVQPIARPAWSADGKTLHVIGLMRTPDRAKNAYEIVTLDVGTGAERGVLPLVVGAFDLARLDDARLVVNRAMSTTSLPQFALWNPGSAEMTPILNDLASFYGISLTSDRSRGVSQRTETRSGVWMGSSTGDAMTQVVEDSAAEPSLAAVDSDGTVYYNASLPDGHSAIYRLAPGGRSEPVVVVDPGGAPRLAADGRSVVFSRLIPKPGWLRVSVDGTNLETILDEFPALSVQVAPDGKTMYFTSTRGGAYTLWSVAIPGGTPRMLGQTGMDLRFSVSPDGRTGAFIDATHKVVLCDLPNCTNVRPARTDVWGLFTPDGRGLSFIPRDDPKNLWVQPFGAAARQLTHFTDKYTINDWSFSRDGRRLVVTRNITTSDIVMIKGLR